MNYSTYLAYAYKDGKLVYIDDVINGDECGCLCPKCHKNLCAKNNGTVKIHHFAHRKGEQDCEGAVESAVHKMAKEIFAEKKLICPAKYLDGNYGKRVIHFNSVEVEETDEKSNLRPDCIGHHSQGDIWVEFFYTHQVKDKKLEYIRKNKINCLEIDLNEFVKTHSCLERNLRNEIQQYLTEDFNHREWVYCERDERFKIEVPEIENLKELHNVQVNGYETLEKKELCLNELKQCIFKSEELAVIFVTTIECPSNSLCAHFDISRCADFKFVRIKLKDLNPIIEESKDNEHCLIIKIPQKNFIGYIYLNNTDPTKLFGENRLEFHIESIKDKENPLVQEIFDTVGFEEIINSKISRKARLESENKFRICKRFKHIQV